MHSIRLRGPWIVARNNQSITIDFPASWHAVYERLGPGEVQLSRRFGQPTGVETGDSLVLVVESTAFVHSAELNGDRLGEVRLGEVNRFDVNSQLAPRNEFKLTAQLPEAAASEQLLATIAEVRLEICQAGPTANR